LRTVLNMDIAGDLAALEKLLRPLSHEMSRELAQAIINLKADEEAQLQYDHSAGKQNERSIAAEEFAQLASFVRANSFLGLLKAQAHIRLNSS
jgi:hypothetical protein